VNAILDLARQAGLDDDKIGLVAPTGRAAKRLEESSGHSGQTIHRYLGFHPQQGFEFDASNQVSHELIVCDEASMLDTFLAKALTAALPNSARLILVGDVHQLPSVGAGNVLRDCINSGTISVTELDTIHRQGEGSWIVENAHAVKNGQTDSLNLSNQTTDFFWEDMAKKHPDLSPHDRSVVMQKRILSAMHGLEKKGFDPASVQVLTPMYKGPVGVATLNNELQTMLNPAAPDKTEAKIGFKTFREGDRVMQLKNDYEKEVFNGDQGWIRKIDTEESKLYIEFDGELVEYQFLETEQLTLAYACTIHKSQGCEFPIAIIPVTTSHYIMLQRNLLYTAITRAKQMCFLLGEKKALGISIKNNKPVCRNTTLESLLKDSNKQEKRSGKRASKDREKRLSLM
jgi:exodeoxyribonuclease V alpha subunit